MSLKELYSKLFTKLDFISRLQQIKNLLEWDQLVMMPSGAEKSRARQCEALAKVIHDKQVEPELGSIIQSLNALDLNELNKWERANVRDAKRNYDKETKLSSELVMKLASMQSKGYNIWVEARKNNDFALFAPILQEWVTLLQEKSKAIDPTKSTYDVCIDDFERGLVCERIDPIFDKLKAGLKPLIKKIVSKPKPDDSFLKGPSFALDKQTEFSHSVAKQIGFDVTCGRLDVSVHPFTISAHPRDTRMTTRYYENNLMEGLSGTVHETGHALYEQGRNMEHENMPVSEPLSMGLHESQSLFWERNILLSEPFWKHYTAILKQNFPQIPSNITAKDLYAAVNIVTPNLIRLEADEVVYPMHIILRYELERDLINGKLNVNDLPELWNQKMKEYIGIVPSTNAEGVLQDVHWSEGLFGYFPSYSFGAIYAAQIFAKACKDIPDLINQIEHGEFANLRAWLGENIHKMGSLYSSGDELMTVVTGEPLNVDFYLNYLTQKYGALYNL